MKKLNAMFHIDGEQLIKTSNGESVPDDEPLFILRGRDRFSCGTLIDYYRRCHDFGTPDDRLTDLLKVIDTFIDYANKNPTKIPGLSHGK